MTAERVRVLVADDSPTARALVVAILESDPGISVIGEARDGVEAVKLARQLRPDVITMDVHMPGMDGLEATREIMMVAPTRIVVVTSRRDPGDVEHSLEVTSAGALMVLEKPDGPSSPDFARRRDHLLAMVHAMAHVKVVRRWNRISGPARMEPVPLVLPRTEARIVAVGASTGGPAAVHQLLEGLPGDFGAPVLLVQHIAEGFTAGLAHWLDQGCALRVKEAEHRERLRPGTVYVAPDQRHLGVLDEQRVALSEAPPINSFRPSATWLFESVARVFGPGAVAVILTGMGNDGVAGLATVRARGGVVMAQDETSCVVYGMPREAVRAGVVHVIGSIPELSAQLRELVHSDFKTR